jgi:uncharacterized protein (TIGR00369 family)
MAEPPAGFSPHFRKSPVTDPWEPLFSRVRDDGAVEIGFHVGPAHSNSRGMLHGGVIAALADNAMGLSCASAAGAGAKGLVTISLGVDYAGAGKAGQWVQIEPRVIRAGRTLAFVDALVTADGAPIARASATFRVME